MRRAKQILPVITAIFGVAYCACNLGLRCEGSPEPVCRVEPGPIVELRNVQEYPTRILLTCTVLATEAAIVGELAYLTWPKYSAWIIWTVLCGVTGSGMCSITLRALVGRCEVCEASRCSTL